MDTITDETCLPAYLDRHPVVEAAAVQPVFRCYHGEIERRRRLLQAFLDRLIRNFGCHVSYAAPAALMQAIALIFCFVLVGLLIVDAARAEFRPRIGPDHFRDFADHADLEAALATNSMQIVLPSSSLGADASAYDLTMIDELFYGELGRRNSVDMLAFTETMLNSNEFTTPSAALQYFDYARSYYASLQNAPEYGDIVRGAIKSGTKFTINSVKAIASDGGVGLDGVAESMIDLAGIYLDFQRRVAKGAADEQAVDFRGFYDQVKAEVSFDPNSIVRPILKTIITKNPNTTDDEYMAAVKQLPATKGDILLVKSDTSGAIQVLLASIEKQYDQLLERYKLLSSNEAANAAELSKIRSQIDTFGQAVETLTSAAGDIQTGLQEFLQLTQKQATAAETQRAQQKVNEAIGLLQNIGSLTGLQGTDKVVGILSAVALAYFSPDPVSIAYATSNVAVMLFGRTRQQNPNEVFLRAIKQLAAHIDERFDRIEEGLARTNEAIKELRHDMNIRFDRIEQKIDRAVVLIDEQINKTRGDIELLKQVMASNYSMGVKMDWNYLANAAASFSRGVYRYNLSDASIKRPSSAIAVANSAAEDKLKEAWTRILITGSPDETGLGHPILSGPTDCLSQAMKEIADNEKFETPYPTLAIRRALDDKALQLAVAFRDPSFGKQSSCIAKLVETIIAAIPPMKASQKWATSLRPLPIQFSDDTLTPERTHSVFSPSALSAFERQILPVIANVADLRIRRELLSELIQVLAPAIQQITLTNSSSGDEILLVAYYGLTKQLAEDIADIFFNPYMKAVVRFDDYLDYLIRAGVIRPDEIPFQRIPSFVGFEWKSYSELGCSGNLFVDYCHLGGVPLRIVRLTSRSSKDDIFLNRIERKSLLTFIHRLLQGVLIPNTTCFENFKPGLANADSDEVTDWSTRLQCFQGLIGIGLEHQCNYQETDVNYPISSCRADLEVVKAQQQKDLECLQRLPARPSSWTAAQKTRFDECSTHPDGSDPSIVGWPIPDYYNSIKNLGSYLDAYRTQMERQLDTFLLTESRDKFPRGLSARLDQFRLRALTLITIEHVLNARLQAGLNRITKSAPGMKLTYTFNRSRHIGPYLRAALLDLKAPGWLFSPFLRSIRQFDSDAVSSLYITDSGAKEELKVALHDDPLLIYATDDWRGVVAEGWKWAAAFGNPEYAVAGTPDAKSTRCPTSHVISNNRPDVTVTHQADEDETDNAVITNGVWPCGMLDDLPILMGVLLQPGVEMTWSNQASISAALIYSDLEKELKILELADKNQRALKNALDPSGNFDRNLRAQIKSWYRAQ